MAQKTATDITSHSRRRWLLLAVLLLLLSVIVTRISSFEDSWAVLGNAEIDWVAAGCLLVAATYVISGGIYTLLALRPLGFGRTVMVQAASAFTNRLLPAGLGGLTLNVQYLRKSKHSTAQALAVAGTNNITGFAGHLLVMLVIVVASGGKLFSELHLPHASLAWVVALIAVAIVLLNVLVFSRLRDYLFRLSADVLKNLLAYRKRPFRLVAALLCSIVLTCSYAGVLYMCCEAVDIHLSLWSVFAVFTVGVAAATATPTPGGLGGAEAGLVAALVAYGTDASTALAAALLYRLLTYWLPMLPGFAFFVAVRKQLL